MLKYQDEWAFVSLYDGLGGPPILKIKMLQSVDHEIQ
jgi:hypothetical protein